MYNLRGRNKIFQATIFTWMMKIKPIFIIQEKDDSVI